jgi:hypothetical protein
MRGTHAFTTLRDRTAAQRQNELRVTAQLRGQTPRLQLLLVEEMELYDSLPPKVKAAIGRSGDFPDVHKVARMLKRLTTREVCAYLNRDAALVEQQRFGGEVVERKRQALQEKYAQRWKERG